jgi:hypothetical protein
VVGKTQGNRKRIGLYAAALALVVLAGCTAQEAADFWNDPAWAGLRTMGTQPYVWGTETPVPEGVLPECTSNCL